MTGPEPWREWVPCRLCGAREFRTIFVAERSGRQVVRCGCGLVFYDPQPSRAQLVELYSGGYFEERYPDARAAEHVDLARRRLARIEAETPVGTLLDVGCGSGRFLAAARERGWKAAGLDVSRAAARLARAASGARVVEGELTGGRPLDLDPVDVLTLWDVLEHLADPVAALAAAPRWLKPGGLLVAQTQNVNSVTAAWMGRRWEQFEEFHLYHFSTATLARALRRAGFDAVRIEAMDAFPRPVTRPAPPPAPAARRALRRLRDALWVLAGRDRFNVMVAMARAAA